MEDGVDGAGGLGGDGMLAHPGERSEGGKPCGHVVRPVGVDRRPTTVVPGVEGGEDVAHFGASALAEDEAVGAHAHGRAHEVGEGDRAPPLDVRGALDEVHAVRMSGRDFCDLFDADDPLTSGDKGERGAQERRFPTSGCPADEDVRARGDKGPQERPHRAGQSPTGREIRDAQPTGAEDAQGDECAGSRHGREDRVEAHAPGQGAVRDGARIVEAHAAGAREADGGAAGVRLVSDTGVHADEAASSVDPRLSAVDEDVGDGWVVEEAREGRVHAALPGA